MRLHRAVVSEFRVRFFLSYLLTSALYRTTGDACWALSRHGFEFDKNVLDRDQAHRELSRLGGGIKATHLRVLFFEHHQDWDRIKNLTSVQVGASFAVSLHDC